MEAETTSEVSLELKGEDMTHAVVRRLPRAQNSATEQIVKHIEPMITGLPNVVADREQFAYALCVAMNEADADGCTAMSVLRAASNVARIGLMPGSVLGLAYFVPYTINKGNKNQRREIQLIIGYRGFCELAYRNNFLRSIHTDCVLRGEEIAQWADESGPHFRHSIPGQREWKYDNLTHAYCQATLNTGGVTFRIMNRAQIDKIKQGGKAWKDPQDAMEMAMKTPLRRLAKQWRLSPEMSLAVRLDEAAELGESQAAIGPPLENMETQQETPAPRTLESMLDEPEDRTLGNGHADEQFVSEAMQNMD